MFIHRDIVQQIGLPDPRFFIYWDDQIYGWLASRKTTVGHRERVRAAPHPRDQAVGHGHPPHERLEQRVPVLHHAQPRAHEALLPLARRLPAGAVRRSGTSLTFAKELIRLVFVERTVRGTSNLFRGLRDGRKIAKDAAWRPMPPLEPVGR